MSSLRARHPRQRLSCHSGSVGGCGLGIRGDASAIVIALFVLGTVLASYNRKKSESTRYSQQDIIGVDADGGSDGGEADGDGGG